MKLNFWYEFKCIDVKVECGEAKTTHFQTFVKLFNLRSALPIFLQSLFLLLSLHVALDMLASFNPIWPGGGGGSIRPTAN